MGATFNRIDVGSKPQTDQSGEIDITDREATAGELARAEPLSAEQFTELAKSVEYRHSSLVRELAIEGRRKAVALEIAEEDTPEAHAARQAEALEKVGNRAEAELSVGRAAFKDPRYKTDAAYRYQVAQGIATSQKTHGTGGTHQLTVGRGTPGEVVHHMRTGPMRVEIQPKLTGPWKPEKNERPEDPRNKNVTHLY